MYPLKREAVTPLITFLIIDEYRYFFKGGQVTPYIEATADSFLIHLRNHLYNRDLRIFQSLSFCLGTLSCAIEANLLALGKWRAILFNIGATSEYD